MKIIVGKANNVKINNLKIAWKLRVISEEEFKIKVKKILNFKNYESLSYPWSVKLGNCLHMISNVKSILCLCTKFVKIIITLNKIMYLSFVESNFFINHFHFLFNPPIPHSTCILYSTCILL